MTERYDPKLIEAGTERLLAIGWPDHAKYNPASAAVARAKAQEMFIAALDLTDASGVAWVAPVAYPGHAGERQVWDRLRDRLLAERRRESDG